MAVSYDIFISYRRFDSYGRVSGRDIARTLQKELQLREYKVFFDYSEIRDDEFERTIIPAIFSSRIFILLLTHDALLRCAKPGDWVHREILTALKGGLKIIPVNPDNQFNGWPANLPADIAAIKGIQISEIATNSLFETSVDLMDTNRIKPIMSLRPQVVIPTSAFSDGFNVFSGPISTRPVSSSPSTTGKKSSPANSVNKPVRKKMGWIKKVKAWIDDSLVGENSGYYVLIIGCFLLMLLPLFFIWMCSNTDNNDGIKIVERDGKSGLVLKGDTILPCEYDSIWIYSGGEFCVFKDGKEGWGSREGVLVIPCEFKSISPSASYLYVEDVNGQQHLYNYEGRRITKKPYRFVWWNEGCELGIVQDSEYKFGYIDSLGNEVITCKYFDARDFQEGKAFVKMKNEVTMKCINKLEQVLFTTPYQNAEAYSEGLAYVEDYSDGGFINEQGQLVIPMKYRKIKEEGGWYVSPVFHNGTAPVSLDGVNGHIDRQGNFTPDE